MKKHVSAIKVLAAEAPGEPAMLVSTPDVDREGDRVMPLGADRQALTRKIPLMWSHQHAELPIGLLKNPRIEPGGLRTSWVWLENDEWADRVRNAWNQGIVNAASIGFLPRRSTPNEFGGEDFHEWELLEVSLCAVPANPRASRTLKSLGLLLEEDLDKDEDRFVDLVDWYGEAFDQRSPIRRAVEAGIQEGIREAGFGGPYIDIEGWPPKEDRLCQR